jgi:hypothetical protein
MALRRLRLRGGKGRRRVRDQPENTEALRQDLEDVVQKLNNFSKELKSELERARSEANENGGQTR